MTQPHSFLIVISILVLEEPFKEKDGSEQTEEPVTTQVPALWRLFMFLV